MLKYMDSTGAKQLTTHIKKELDSRICAGAQSDGINLISGLRTGFYDNGNKAYPTLLKSSYVNNEQHSDMIELPADKKLVLQMWITAPKGVDRLYWINLIWFDEGKAVISQNQFMEMVPGNVQADTFKYVLQKPVPPDNAKYVIFNARFYNDGKAKLEHGIVPTPWTPAPEDITTVNVSNPNILDNWFFEDPINQYGIGFMTDIIDRWVFTRMNVDLTKSGLEVMISDIEANTNGNGWIGQRIPHDLPGVIGSKVTFSAIVDDELFSLSAVLMAKGSDPESATRQYISNGAGFTLRFENLSTHGAENFAQFQIFFYTKGHKYTVKAAKVEFGDKQTLAHKENGKWILNDPPPDKALELLKCQRHNLVLNSNGATYGVVGHGVGTSSTTANIQIPIPVEMRATPSVRFSGNWCLSASTPSSDHKTVTKMTVDSTSSNNSYIGITVEATGLTAGTFYRLCADNDATARIILDANL